MSVGVYRLAGLKAAREAAGLTQNQLARRAGLTVSAVINMELQREPLRVLCATPREARQLADALGTDLAGIGAVSMIPS